MKKTYFFIVIFITQLFSAQIPAGYYSTAAGLRGEALKARLSAIITNGHSTQSYAALYNAYPTTDTDKFFEDDNTVLDMYSENPNSSDPYNFTHGSNQCGNYSNEGDCYNREHIVPQSLFNSASPMVSDVNFIRPTDGKVNGIRSNYPFGIVVNPSGQSPTANGGKIGTSSLIYGYNGTVFEPIDTFKGDVARMVFYFVTRYESRLFGFSTGNILGGSSFPGLQTWELNILRTWSEADPVSTEEVARNNASYVFQGNRNPFIDHPEYVDLIWGASVTDITAPSATTLSVSNVSYNFANLTWSGATDNVKVFEYDVYVNGVLRVTTQKTSATVWGLTPSTAYSFYVVVRDIAGNSSANSNTANATTLAQLTSTGASCGYESFDNFTINTTSANYLTRNWTNNSVTWTATNARVDQKINNDNSICLKNGVLTSSSLPYGISSLTVTTQSKFGNTSGTYTLRVNGVVKGTIPYSNVANTYTISDLNISGNVVISLTETTTGSTNRVAFDNLNWTCFSVLAVDEINANRKLYVYPNPVKNSEIFISGISNNEEVKIYSMTGQLLQTISNVKDNQKITIKQLPKGSYLLKTNDNSTKLIID